MFVASLYLICGHVVVAQTQEAAVFVAGFDRFGRHADIQPNVAGRLLLTELSCTACHSSSDALLSPKRGPKLDGAGSNLQSDWIRRFLISPSAAKPGTTMPEILGSLPEPARDAAANALTAYLASLQESFPELKATGLVPVPVEFWERGNLEHGRMLYHQIGCVACHESDKDYEVAAVKPSPLDQLLEQLDPAELAEMGLSSAARKINSVPHADLTSKYHHQSLTFFLLKPETTRVAGRMPNFGLTPVDAADIAAWLLSTRRTSGNISEKSAASTATVGPSLFSAELVDKGRKLFVQMKCVNCHSVTGLKVESSAGPLADLNVQSAANCVTSHPAVTADTTSETSVEQPYYLVDDVQRTALMNALREQKRGSVAPALSNAARLQFHALQLNCFACHERDKLGGTGRYRKPYFETVGNVDIGDEGRLPPTLTGVGRKLTTASLSHVLAGKSRIRPHMTIRMPQFAAAVVKPLPGLFESVDLIDRKTLSEPIVPDQDDRNVLVAAGRTLMDTGCVQCHAFRGEYLPGIVGVDLTGVTQRVRPEWLHEFLKDPGALKDRTRMPTFFPNGQSQNKELLDGNVDRQIAAMVAYLNDLEKQPLPAKIVAARAQNYELTPTDRPILLRTFMPTAGTHAIAVGFAQKVHFAFDAENLNVAEVWRGRFLDAEGTWFVRSAPPAPPLGDHPVRLPQGPFAAILESPSAAWPDTAEKALAQLSGYRLDHAGIPTFLYRVGHFEIEDRLEPFEATGLKRSLRVRRTVAADAGSALWLRAHAGPALQQQSLRVVRDQSGLTVTLGKSLSGQLRSIGDTKEWLVPLNVERAAGSIQTTEVLYQW